MAEKLIDSIKTEQPFPLKSKDDHAANDQQGRH